MKYILRYGHIRSYPPFLGHPVQTIEKDYQRVMEHSKSSELEQKRAIGPHIAPIDLRDLVPYDQLRFATLIDPLSQLALSTSNRR